MERLITSNTENGATTCKELKDKKVKARRAHHLMAKKLKKNAGDTIHCKKNIKFKKIKQCSMRGNSKTKSILSMPKFRRKKTLL